jgi:hypothetical protein
MVDNTKVINRIESEIEKLNNKDFTLYFFTVDSKNTPSGMLVYTYELAYQLKNMGFKVCMLYQVDNEYTDREIRKQQEKGTYDPMNVQTFCGVGDWMGEEYASLPHLNISRNGVWSVAPSDFLFIPDAFTSLMTQTYIHKIPCHRYVLLTNFDYVTDSVPLGTQWANFGIKDCIAISELQGKLIKDVMPYVNVDILNPMIPEYFRKSNQPKKLVVNIISKKQSDINKRKDLLTKNMFLSLLVPTLIHGFYDYCLITAKPILIIVFYIFVILIYIFAFRRVIKLSKIQVPLKPTFCTKCGLKSTGNFCPNCGNKM